MSMISEDVRHLVEAELQPGEELLWAEEIDLQSFRLRKWVINIFFVLFMNAVILLLYISQFGGFSLKTTITVLAAGNMGALALLGFELHTDLKARNARAGHAITNLRIFTLAWDDFDSNSLSKINLENLNDYEIKKDRHLHKISLLGSAKRAKQTAKFQIHTARDPLDIEAVISRFLSKGTTP